MGYDIGEPVFPSEATRVVLCRLNIASEALLGSLRGSEATEAISQSLGYVVAGKDSEITALPLVARNDAGVGYIRRLADFHAHGRAAGACGIPATLVLESDQGTGFRVKSGMTIKIIKLHRPLRADMASPECAGLRTL